MSRDHRKLKAFELADTLALDVYRATDKFPKHEMFGLTAQLRRGSTSVAINIVEGCARRTQPEYIHFLNMAFASLREVGYELSLAHRLGYLDTSSSARLLTQYDHAARVLSRLISSMELGP